MSHELFINFDESLSTCYVRTRPSDRVEVPVHGIGPGARRISNVLKGVVGVGRSE